MSNMNQDTDKNQTNPGKTPQTGQQDQQNRGGQGGQQNQGQRDPSGGQQGGNQDRTKKDI